MGVSLPVTALLAAAFVVGQDVIGLERAPLPTAAPARWQVDMMLNRRIATSGTCGWISGLTLMPVSCSPNYQCVHNPYYNAFGCCSGSVATCVLPTVCYDRENALKITTPVDSFTFLCTDAQSSYCQTYLFPSGTGGDAGFGCGAYPTLVEVSSSLGVGYVAGGVTTAMSYPESLVQAAVTNSSGGDESNGPIQNGTSDGSSGSDSGSGGSNGGSNNSSSGSSGGGGLSTGAIVGIAVAAAVVAVTAIAVIGFICYKRNRRPSIVPQPQPQPQPQQQHPPGPPTNMAESTVLPSTVPSSTLHSGAAGNTSFTSPSPGPQGGSMVGSSVGYGHRMTTEHDGIQVTEIMPEDAVDEPKPHMFAHPGMGGSLQNPGTPGPIQHPGSPPPGAYYPVQYSQQRPGDVLSTVAPTAVSPTYVSFNPQNV